ncbi:MAG: hypothetical protein PHT07_24950 [Paludibacter sp.]|nr:hypothetical protein [Paludibacter sp.]
MESKEIVSDIARFEKGLMGIIKKMQAMSVTTQETRLSMYRQGRVLNELKTKKTKG